MNGRNLQRHTVVSESAIAPYQLRLVNCSLTKAVLGDELADKLCVRVEEKSTTAVKEKKTNDDDLDWESKFADSDDEADVEEGTCQVLTQHSPELHPTEASFPYLENYHWHSGTRLDSDLRQTEDNNRSTQKYIKFMHNYAESLEGTTEEALLPSASQLFNM